ncbi:MAG TPA: metallophosphoesterase [bacterium]|nr:metallophosphoesterase [bacterium]
MFGLYLSLVAIILHWYVFQRLSTFPLTRQRLPRRVLCTCALVMLGLFLAGRWLGHHAPGWPALVLEQVGLCWLVLLFLLAFCLLIVDSVTLFGLILRPYAVRLCAAALAVGLVLVLFVAVQGWRAPEIESYTVALPGLPADLDGAVLVVLSDLHLGTMFGPDWLAGRIDEVQALRPDLVVLAGDIFEGRDAPAEAYTSIFHRLQPRLGVYAVPGNHEYYGRGRAGSVLDTTAGFIVLRNTWVQPAPGLVIAGIDDLTVQGRTGQDTDYLTATLPHRPAGATVLLSHTPWQVERAAAFGVGLMLSGHTHNGQVWPFNYIVRQVYPHIAGQYQCAGMTLIVSRGTGLWGPRMRLWQRGEISHITLKRK